MRYGRNIAIVLGTQNFDRLSEAERHVLLLLARGHTIKSAAQNTGWTEAAVNERLRSARQKTGVGSSRELARRYARKVGNEFSGLAGSDDCGPRVERPARSRVDQRRGLLMLIVIGLMGATALWIAQPSDTDQRGDPLIGQFIDNMEPIQWVSDVKSRKEAQERVAAEGNKSILRKLHAMAQPSASVSARSEQHREGLSDIFRPIADTYGVERVSCGERLCEVVLATALNPPDATAAKFVDDVQQGSLNKQVQATGLKLLQATIGNNGHGRVVFISYYVPSTAS